MRIAVGCDHRGVDVKARLVPLLEQLGHQVVDRGVHDATSVDYPDIACQVAGMVSEGQADRGILICGTGIGMAITANKFPNVRAATCHDEFEAEMCRRHNDVNVLCLSGHMVGERNLEKIIQLWLNTEFEGGRHARRLQKIRELEAKLNGRTDSASVSCGGDAAGV
ncbi:MAG: ribose 5-phosphate isomerase B [Pirellulaceae bacterium]|nr:MAG: ribose 5-phosphate isomerase B [Pirellulaceae bacterium]